MDLSFRFDLWYARLPRSPAARGAVTGCVLRPRRGERLRPAALELDLEQGVVGDGWTRDPDRRAGNQVSLINVHVLASLAANDPERMALSGDNLQVDLDLSEANLPVGTRLVVGTAELEVSAEPHRPCRHFVERFGAVAAKKVARANRVGKRARGVLCSVVRGGRVQVGDVIEVRRPGGVSSGP